MEPLDPRTASRARGLVVLDTRSDEEFARGHPPGSGHIPRLALSARRSELPPRDTAILVVAAGSAAARDAAAEIEALGYARVHWLDAPLEALEGGLGDRGPAARLWRPAPFLVEVLPEVEAALAARPRDTTAPKAAAEPPRALDLACGAGRDSVFLAERGFEVHAWDHAPEALERAGDLAHRHGFGLRTALCDLERPSLPTADLPFDLVVCFRFLHRPLFPWIERALAPGGWLVYETFRVGQERYGRPRRPHFMLESGELAHSFPALETMRYEEPEPEGGPVTARLLARRPADGGPP